MEKDITHFNEETDYHFLKFSSSVPSLRLPIVQVAMELQLPLPMTSSSWPKPMPAGLQRTCSAWRKTRSSGMQSYWGLSGDSASLS